MAEVMFNLISKVKGFLIIGNPPLMNYDTAVGVRNNAKLEPH